MMLAASNTWGGDEGAELGGLAAMWQTFYLDRGLSQGTH